MARWKDTIRIPIRIHGLDTERTAALLFGTRREYGPRGSKLQENRARRSLFGMGSTCHLTVKGVGGSWNTDDRHVV